ncbi:putative metal-binding protein, possibly nucleic-acid binding protein [Aequorivita sublithincola DSM 14238]|uniref:Putative metal-binding protein, possibly nucleic-acid binding protein n=1 Tax=Aequorivita sublithincola (strain DSM 14238 / LMG 21431 / ACAM 643 / 9-3) TaxID=746697 RepID=I3YUG1_AEQSU|nr:DUF177 domain-containing protein [Aequorivita sublithincola]AFL80629.1 putative metal-binding protein, possibly nucleic-acid binding protein [Aequorivita sublithincola DSM 14238]
MKDLKEFTIPFVGLKLGKHQFNFELKKAFFEHFEYDEFNDAAINLDVLLEKMSTLLEFTLTYNGTVNVACDTTNEPFDQEVDGEYKFVVKFGDEYNDENEDLLILSHGSYEVNIQQYIFESIVLAMPSRKVHPGVKDGTLKSDILDKLEELSPKDLDEQSEPEDDNTDPRWDSLKKLLTDK